MIASRLSVLLQVLSGKITWFGESLGLYSSNYCIAVYANPERSAQGAIFGVTRVTRGKVSVHL